MFKKILIANRGEIAVRVIRSCREMDIQTVAVFSEPDRSSLHVKLADEAYCIGPASSAESYLNQDKIIAAAKQSGAEAIHPGYGFLSENACFSERCKSEGIVFIGPDAYAIETMGDKITARKKMLDSGVPVVPGTKEDIADEKLLLQKADQIGYPIMVKATAGGGGKGMRLVTNDEELITGVRQAKSEAQSAFGNADVYIEKFVSSPHHIEFQILADNHGNCIHLNERECSVQRRHQKVVEETPSPLMTAELRKEMGEKAVAAAKAVNYSGAGTVEFLVDDNRNYYFLEMNTRLQVEHPVTELTTGIDLVKEQIKIADNQKLKIRQEDVRQFGHAIEIRVYAEDPENNFMPNPGTISYIREPSGIGVRNDGYVYSGFEIPIHYDPMISKLIVWGSNRREAIDRMIRAIDEYKLTGVKNSLNFIRRIMQAPAFVQGRYDTKFIEDNIDFLLQKPETNETLEDLAAVTAYLQFVENLKSNGNGSLKTQETKRWKDFGRKQSVGKLL
jgi:acetyl-CoA carboxylase, biotin carboxylase subunit